MLWFLAVFVIGLLITALVAYKNRGYGPGEVLTVLGLGTLTSLAVGILLGGFFLNMIASGFVGEKSSTTRIEIASLQDNSNIKGKFFLGTGQVGEEFVFSYYEVNNNRYSLKSVPADSTSVVETNDKPWLEKVHITADNQWLDLFTDRVEYVFHVPEGSVLNNYNLDAQ